MLTFDGHEDRVAALVDAFTPPNPDSAVHNTSAMQVNENEIKCDSIEDGENFGIANLQWKQALGHENSACHEHMNPRKPSDKEDVDEDAMFPDRMPLTDVDLTDMEQPQDTTFHEADEEDLLFTTPLQLLRVVESRIAEMKTLTDGQVRNEVYGRLLELRHDIIHHLGTAMGHDGKEEC